MRIARRAALLVVASLGWAPAVAEGACSSARSVYADAIRGTYGVVGQWRLDERSAKVACAAVGSAGRYRAGTRLGGAGALAGERSSAITLAGRGGVSLPGLRRPRRSATVELWVRPRRGGPQAIVDTSRWTLMVDASGRLTLRTSARRTIVTARRPLAPNRWHHVALALDDDRAQIRQDARTVATARRAPRTGGAMTVGRGRFGLGFRGSLDEVALYDRALSADETALHRRIGRTVRHPETKTVVAAGDIACDPESPHYAGGAGTPVHCQQRATSELVVAPGLSAVLTLGDNQYEDATLDEFRTSFDPTWGRARAIMRPAPGNHEYRTPAASGYFDYFNGVGAETGPAGRRGEGWYSFDVGAWHVVALNSNCREAGGCGLGSPQVRWLRADLAASRARCTLAFWHHPRFTSEAEPGSPEAYSGFFKTLRDGGADAVLVGHAHSYERFAPQDEAGRLDAARGLRQFVVGTGGDDLRRLGPPRRNSEVRNADTFGVLRLELGPASYTWSFQRAAGGTFSDAGTQVCH